MKWSVDKLNTIRFSATIITLIGLALLSLLSLLRLQDTTRQVRQARQTLLQTEILISLLKDAETGQRGYLLTGEEKYLQPYYRALSIIDNELDELAYFIQNDSYHQTQFTELQALTQAKLSELEQTIELRRNNQLQSALAIVKTAQGDQLMEQIRETSDAIKAEQQVLLEQRSIYEQQSTFYTTYLTLGSVALQILLITGIILHLNKETQNLQYSKAELSQSEERYRSLVTATAQVVWIADRSGLLLTISPIWQTITGQSEQDAKGWGWLSAIDSDDQHEVRQKWQIALSQQQLYEAECRVCSTDKSCRYFLVRGVPVLRADNSVREWIGTYVDITERKQAEQALKEARDALEVKVQERTKKLAEINLELQAEIRERQQIEYKLEQFATSLQHSNQELEQFAYVASHDLQEPLRTVASYTQLLAKKYEGKLDEKADKYINYVVDGATRMQQLINDLLLYSRVGKQSLNLTLVDCNQLIHQVCSLLNIVIDESHATIKVNPLPEVLVDPSHFAKLFQNLISNAIKYRGNDPPKIEITAHRTEREWLFLVQDNGIGIEPQYAERIFIIFQRLHTRREYSGTGIGLAICKKIVELHKGRIWVESQLGHGATFYISLPYPIQA